MTQWKIFALVFFWFFTGGSGSLDTANGFLFCCEDMLFMQKPTMIKKGGQYMKSLTDLIWTDEDVSKATKVANPSIIFNKPMKDLCIALFCTYTGGGGSTDTASTPFTCGKDSALGTLACR